MSLEIHHTSCCGKHNRRPRLSRTAVSVSKAAPRIDWLKAERVVDRNAPALARLFNRLFRLMGSLVTTEMWQTALRTGDPTAITAMFDQVKVQDSGLVDPVELMKSVYEDVQILVNDTAEDYLKIVVPISMKAGGEAYAAVGGVSAAEAATSFTVMNPYVVPSAERRVGWLIQEVVRSSNQGIRQAVANAVADTYARGVGRRETERMIRSIVGLRGDQVDALRAVEQRLIAQGLSGKKLASRMVREQSKRLRYRAEMIARTEIRLAQSTGRHDGWKSARDDGLFKGKKAVVEWIADQGPRTCPICLDLDGQTQTLGDEFKSTDALPPERAVNGETPPVHPLCRCTTILRLEG